MAFTKEEFEAWHKAKLEREFPPMPAFQSAPLATCIHRHQPFGITEGTIADEVAICDVCDGD